MAKRKDTMRYAVPFGLTASLAFPFVAAAALPTSCAQFVTFFKNLGDGLSAIIFALAIIMLLISAFYFLTGGGSEDAQKKAKTLLIYALVGLTVALFAFVLPNIIESVLGGTRGNC